MADDSDSDSDSSSSTPGAPPGSAPLTFLPVNINTNKNDNNNNNMDKSNNDNNIEDINNDIDDDDSDDSDSSNSNLGLPGQTISFIPIQSISTNNNNNNNNDTNNTLNKDDDNSDSSSSSSSTPTGPPPGNAPITFLPTNPTPKTQNKIKNEESDEETLSKPGGGHKLTFLQTNHTRSNRKTNDYNNNNNNNNSNINDIDDTKHGFTMLSYPIDGDSRNGDDLPNLDDMNSNSNTMNSLLSRIESGKLIDDNTHLMKKRSITNVLYQTRRNEQNEQHQQGSLSQDDMNLNDEDELSPTPNNPRISMARTMNQINNNNNNTANKPQKHRKIRSSTLAETRQKHKDSAIWDLVYMTASPLVCVADFDEEGKVMEDNKNDDNNYKKVIALELLDVSRETEEFMNVLGSAEKQFCVVHEIATSGNLIKAMAHECRILHYSGHGFPSYLAFEDENSIGDTHMLRDSAFKKIVTRKDSNNLQLKFVFTSACHSESVGQAFVSAGVPHVVSIDTKFEVSDEGAMTFTKYFYEALLAGRTIRDSFKLAKQSVEFISSSAKRDFEKFKLLPKKGNHDVALFKNLNTGKLVNKSTKLPPNNLPTTIQPFIGRSIDMREIIHSFMAKKNETCRILNIYGDRGVGKTSIAIMVGRYLNDRKIYFKNGIFYISIKKLIANQDATTLTEMINFVINRSFVNYDGNNHNNHNKNYHGNNSDELISNLKLFCRYGLFIIDDIDQLIQFYRTNELDVGRELFQIIFKILIEVSEKIKFIIISKKICNDIYKYNNNSQLSPKTYHLKRLSSVDCSNLFSKLTAGQWRPNDIKENIDIMSILKNNPLQIHQLAKLKNQWQCQTLTKLVETYNFKNKLQRKQGKNLMFGDESDGILQQTQRKQTREQLIKQYILNPSAQQVWRKAHGMELCDYYKIFEILKYDFTEYTFSKRKLQQNNLMDCFRILGMNQDLTINIDKFDNLYKWFNGLTRLVQVLSKYWNQTNPYIIIHGFVSRQEAQKMLLNNKNNNQIPIGSFIIRFRYKEPKSIAISYKQTINNISNLKCDLSNNNDSTFICGKKLMILEQFILSFPALKYLYTPKKVIPKEEIFIINQQQHQHHIQQPHFSMAQSVLQPQQQQHHFNNNQNQYYRGNNNPVQFSVSKSYNPSYH